MYKVLNINTLTLFISRTPKRLKTSCESTSEEAGLARRKTKFKIPFQFPDLSKTACIITPLYLTITFLPVEEAASYQKTFLSISLFLRYDNRDIQHPL